MNIEFLYIFCQYYRSTIIINKVYLIIILFNDTEECQYFYSFEINCKIFFKSLIGGQRYRKISDGQKLVCFDPGFSTSQPGNCTVISLGINNEWSFDDGISQKGCKASIENSKIRLQFLGAHHLSAYTW